MVYCTNGQICRDSGCSSSYRKCAGDTKTTHVLVDGEMRRVVDADVLADLYAKDKEIELLRAELTKAQAELSAEKKLSEAISRDCNATALQRNALRDELTKAQAEIERMRPVLEAAKSHMILSNYCVCSICQALRDYESGAKP